MIWNRPKAIISKLTLLLSLGSLFCAVFWLYIYFIWQNNPQKVNEYDLGLKNKYTDKIARLHTRTKKGKSAEETFNRLKKYVNALNGITPLHTDYNYYTEAQEDIIDHLLKNNKLEQAKQYAYKWQKKHENDFNAKYKYIEVLQKTSIDEAISYYEQIFNKHSDIYEFSQNYIDYLISQGKIKKAEEIAGQAIRKYKTQKKALFMLYYADIEYKKFDSESRIVFSDIKHQKTNNTYILKTEFSTKGITKLRFDIDNQLSESKIEKLNITIKTQGKTYLNISFAPLHSIKEQGNNFVIIGKDPYFEVLLPEEVIDTNKKIQFFASLQIESGELKPLKKLTDNKEWQLFYANEARFNEKDTIKFNIKKEGDFYQAKLDIKKGNYQFVRLDLPAIKKLVITDLVIKNQDKNLDISDSILVHLDKINNKTFKVTDKDPYIIIDLQKKEQLENISLSFKLGEQQ